MIARNQNESKQHDINLWAGETKPFSLELFLIEEIELRKCTVKINYLFSDCPAHQLILQTRWCFKRFRFSLLLRPRSCLTAQRFLSQFDVELKSHEGRNLFSRISRKSERRRTINGVQEVRHKQIRGAKGGRVGKTRLDALIRWYLKTKAENIDKNLINVD